MKKLAPTVLTGVLFGAVTGAALAGVSEYFNERWEWADIDVWVLPAAVAGASLGGGVGGLTGLVVAAFRYRAGNAKFR